MIFATLRAFFWNMNTLGYGSRSRTFIIGGQISMNWQHLKEALQTAT
tara:strand:- start:181 stop:321 length:141 start_codon:yes stop_codon:yes gene_type:complete